MGNLLLNNTSLQAISLNCESRHFDLDLHDVLMSL